MLIKKIIIVTLLSSLSIGLWSNQKIGKIEISGLKRTNPSVVYDLLNIKEGDDFTNFNEEEFKQDVLKTGIFSTPQITYSEIDETVNLDIIISEKWTLIPLPIISVDSEKSSFGITAFDSNFLGLKKIAILSGAYTTQNKFRLSMGYIDDKLITDDIGMSLFFRSSNQNSDTPDFVASTTLFSDISDFRLSIGVYYSHIIKEQTFDLISPIFSITLDRQTLSETKAKGGVINVSYTGNINLSSNSYIPDLKGTLSYTFNPFNRTFLAFKVKGTLFDKPDLLETKYGSREGSRSLTIKDGVDQTLSGDLTLEIIVFDLKSVAISSLGFFELGLYTIDSSIYNYYGPGGGLRVYLKGIAVPALGVDYGYNIQDKEHNFSFNLGVSM